jgi:hypothetical protein
MLSLVLAVYLLGLNLAAIAAALRAVTILSHCSQSVKIEYRTFYGFLRLIARSALILPTATPLCFDHLIAGQLLKVTTLAQTCQIPHLRFAQPFKTAGRVRRSLFVRAKRLPTRQADRFGVTKLDSATPFTICQIGGYGFVKPGEVPTRPSPCIWPDRPPAAQRRVNLP